MMPTALMPGALLPNAETAPFWLLFGVFFGIAALRTQVTYWLARVATNQVLNRSKPTGRVMTRVHAWLGGGSADRGVTAINRWGVLMVPASFLMVGSKTIINAAAGVTRMPFGKYLPAMIVGCSLHATIYATVGWAAWTSALAAAAGSPWAIAAVIALLTLLVVAVMYRRRRRATVPGLPNVSEPPEVTTATEAGDTSDN